MGDAAEAASAIAAEAGALPSLDATKDAILTSLSHELRTPLTAILGFGIMLKEHRAALSEEEVDEFVHRIVANSIKLQHLIEDLLDLDRLKRGVTPLQRHRIDVSRIARVAVLTTTPSDRDVRVEINPLWVSLDPSKTERIIECLVANAIKHTRVGTTVWVRAEPVGTGVLIKVEDDGDGVPDEIKRDVFDAFHRGPDAPHHAPGAGIGLTLVQRYAELHGGFVRISDREGGGASLEVLLPGPEEIPALLDLNEALARP